MPPIVNKNVSLGGRHEDCTDPGSSFCNCITHPAGSTRGSPSPPMPPKCAEEEEEGAAAGFVMRELLREEGPFALLVQAGQALHAEGRWEEARELASAALDVCGKRWAHRWKRDAVRLLAARGAIAAHDLPAALHNLRLACARWPLASQPWNSFAL